MLEEKLYAPAHQDDSAGETMYPAYLVAMTSLAGLMAARRLQADGMLSPVRGNCVEEGDDVGGMGAAGRWDALAGEWQ